MTDSSAESPASRPLLSLSALARPFIPALLISAAGAFWCRCATGPTLGLFLGGLLVATLIAPPLAVSEKPSDVWLLVIAIILGTALVWATGLHSADVTTWEWLRCCLVLATFVLALTGIAMLLGTIRIPPSPASGLTVLLGLLWFTWPVWLSPWLTQPMADWLVPANPIFAVNGVLPHLGTWDRAPLAYRVLSSLNQDVPYRLPGSITPACIIHAMIGCATLTARHLHKVTQPGEKK